jgi:hypothetical protein
MTDTFTGAESEQIGRETQELDGQVEAQLGDSAAPAYDPNNIKMSIKSTDMSENMIIFLAEKTLLAFEAAAEALENPEEGKILDYNTLLSQFIKEQMEIGYGPSWHVIVGDDYGGFFTHEKFNSIVFCLNHKWITVFKSNVPVSENAN